MQNNSKPAPVKQNEFYQALVKNKTALQSYQSVKSSKEDLAKGFSSQKNPKRDKEVRQEYDIQSVSGGGSRAAGPDTMFDPKVMSEHLQSSQQYSEEKIPDPTKSKSSENSISKI